MSDWAQIEGAARTGRQARIAKKPIRLIGFRSMRIGSPEGLSFKENGRLAVPSGRWVEGAGPKIGRGALVTESITRGLKKESASGATIQPIQR